VKILIHASPEDARQIKRFIVLKKVEDETNIVLNFKKQEGRTSSGIVLPADIPKSLQDRAGNIVKELKSQNLIS
jgi:co-chaperonin GroES (HSP10)